mgnify:FL=1
MIVLPVTERDKFTATVNAEAKRYGLLPSDYLRKIWYHEEAAKLGEYVAMSLVEELVQSLSLPVDRNHPPADYYLNKYAEGAQKQ